MCGWTQRESSLTDFEEALEGSLHTISDMRLSVGHFHLVSHTTPQLRTSASKMFAANKQSRELFRCRQPTHPRLLRSGYSGVDEGSRLSSCSCCIRDRDFQNGGNSEPEICGWTVAYANDHLIKAPTELVGRSIASRIGMVISWRHPGRCPLTSPEVRHCKRPCS